MQREADALTARIPAAALEQLQRFVDRQPACAIIGISLDPIDTTSSASQPSGIITRHPRACGTPRAGNKPATCPPEPFGVRRTRNPDITTKQPSSHLSLRPKHTVPVARSHPLQDPFIPAPAEYYDCNPHRHRISPIHPRTRGTPPLKCCSHVIFSGSSPRPRDTGNVISATIVCPRFIPAPAGHNLAIRNTRTSLTQKPTPRQPNPASQHALSLHHDSFRTGSDIVPI